MITAVAVYNPRNSDGSVSNWVCDGCGKIGAAYIEITTGVAHRPYEVHKSHVCRSCLEDWGKLINNIILKDVMDSVQRRKEKENV
jgi:hypothetical protein